MGVLAPTSQVIERLADTYTMGTPEDQRLLLRLRKALDLPEDVSDEEVLSMTDGSLFRAFAELGVAVEILREAVLLEVKSLRAQLLRRLP